MGHNIILGVKTRKQQDAMTNNFYLQSAVRARTRGRDETKVLCLRVKCESSRDITVINIYIYIYGGRYGKRFDSAGKSYIVRQSVQGGATADHKLSLRSVRADLD